MGRMRRKRENSIGQTMVELDISPEGRQDGEAQEEQQAVDGDTVKRRVGRPKKAQAKEQEVEVEVETLAKAADESRKVEMAREELKAAEAMQRTPIFREQTVVGNQKRKAGRPRKLKKASPVTSPSNPTFDRQAFNDANTLEAWKSVKSNVQTEELDIAAEGGGHGQPKEEEQPGIDDTGGNGQTKEEEQPGIDDTVKRKRGRPKLVVRRKQDVEGAAAVATDEFEIAEKAKKALEAAEGVQSTSASGEQVEDRNQKRRVSRPKNLQKDIQVTSPFIPNADKQGVSDAMGPKTWKSVNSNGETGKVDPTAEGRRYDQAEEQQSVETDTGKHKRGRPQKFVGKKQEVEGAAVTVAVAREESETRDKAKKELEAAEELQSIPASGEEPVNGNQKRNVGRLKKLKVDNEKTSPSIPTADKGLRDVIGRTRGSLVKSNGVIEEVDNTPEGREHGRTEEEQLPVDDDTVKRTRGGTKKFTGKKQVIEAAAVTMERLVKSDAVIAEVRTRGRSVKSDEVMEEVEGRQHGQTEEQPVVDPTVKGKRGRPKKSEAKKQEVESEETGGAEKELEPAERKQRTRLDAELGTDENQKRTRGRPLKSGTEDLKSTPSSSDKPVAESQKRKVGRPKKLKTESEGTKSEGRDGAANGGQQVTDRRRSSRGKAGGEQKPASRKTPSTGLKKEDTKPSASAPKMAERHYLSKIEVDGTEFQVGNDVYVKNSDGDVSESDTGVEDCRICGTRNEETMLECDDCLCGFHLTCLNPPLETLPEDDWICPYCEKGENPPLPPSSQRRHRSARDRLLALDLWAARIERIWRKIDGTLWFTAHWFMVPEETALGRQPHHRKRELFRINRRDDNEIDSILRRCYVMSPKAYKNAAGEGDDVFFCEYEYNEHSRKFKRIKI